jgi:uncharacterized protein (TIGR00297 family)
LTADIFTGLLLALAVSSIAWYRKWLSIGGAATATVMGTMVWAIAGWQAAVPMLLFFVSSSILSLALRATGSSFDQKDRQPRDAIQVMCNGGIAVLCLLFFYFLNTGIWLWAYWASIAVSTADTWSSAIGNRFTGTVIDIKNGKPLRRGLSGGISVAGTLGGVAGAGIIALAGWLLNDHSFYWTGVLLTGFAGMMIDSVLGSLFQARYRLVDGSQVEFEPAGGAVLEKGWRWLSNDLVNLLSNLIATLVALAVFMFCS